MKKEQNLKKEFINQKLSKNVIQSFLLKAGVIAFVGVVGLGGFKIYAAIKERKEDKVLAAAYRTIQDSKNNLPNTTTYADIEDQKVVLAKKELKAAKEHMSSLGSILLFKRSIDVTHSEVLDEDNKYAQMTIEYPADFWDYLDIENMEFRYSEHDKKNHIYIPEITIDPDNVYIDSNVAPKVIHHPEPELLTTDEKPKNWLETWYKRSLANKYANHKVKPIDVMKLDQQLELNKRTVAYKTILEKLATDKEYMKDLNDIAVEVVKNIYNPQINAYTAFNKDGEEVNVHFPLQTPYEVHLIKQSN